MNRIFIISLIAIFSVLFINLGISIKKDIEETGKIKKEINLKVDKKIEIKQNKKQKRIKSNKNIYQVLLKNRNSFV